MRFVCFVHQTTPIFLNNNDRLVFVMGMHRVFFLCYDPILFKFYLEVLQATIVNVARVQRMA